MSDASYGLWSSPITPKSLAQGLRFGDALWDSDGRTLVWLEGRGDRGVLVASTLTGDAPRDLTEELSVRARVGYGEGDFGVGGGNVFFVSGGRIYRQNLTAGKPKALTPEFGQAASPTLSPDGKWLLYVFSYERRDGLAVVDAEGKLWPAKVAEGHDFYMQPRWSADGRRAAWIAWDHPQMPWDGTRLFLADVDASVPPASSRHSGRPEAGGTPRFRNEQTLAGGEDIAIFQPEFSPDGKYLSYLSDESGWFNFFLYELESGATRRLTNEDAAQLGTPAWVQGQRTYGWSHDARRIYCIRNAAGLSRVMAYDVATGAGEPVTSLDAYTGIAQPALHPKRALLAASASSSVVPGRLIVQELVPPASGRPECRPEAGGTLVVKRATSETVPAETLVRPVAVSWPGAHQELVHGLLYATRREDLPGRPPAILRVHGGPTSQSRAAYAADIQFFATRGYTVLDVNYRGSTGFGREYMNALRGQWGVSDVEDVVTGARYLAAQGLADAERLVILGGSAGGYTVLQALIKYPRFFRAGVCLYGVSNLFTLAADTHKFEERYLDSLIGPLPEAGALYRERSPVFHAEKLVDPLALFQGEQDEVVPKAQAEQIVESLVRRGVPHEYQVYAGEGHGWRKAETIEAYYRAVEAFLKRYVLFA